MTEVWNVNIDLDYNLYSNVTYKNTTGWNLSGWLPISIFMELYFHDIFSPFSYYTGGKNVWGDRPFYLVKQPQEKWVCDFHDDAPPLSFQLQVAEVIF